MKTAKYLFSSLLLLFLSTTALADNQSLVSANNQVSLNLLLQNQKLNYGANPNNYPLSNLHGDPYGLNFSLSKTFNHWYTALMMSATNANLSYNDTSLDLSKATSFVQQVHAKLGWSFSANAVTSLTPYITAAYQHSQLDSGGFPLFGLRMLGITQVTQSLQYGAGLLGQWAATPRWVLGTDLTLLKSAHTWTYATIPFDSSFFYHQTTLGSNTEWRLALSSDYKLTSKLHGLLGVKYLHSSIGGGQTQEIDLALPSQQNQLWQYSAGLGYDLDNSSLDAHFESGSHRTLITANNEASLSLGYLYQNYGEFLDGHAGYLDRQTGQMPQLKMALTKTWKNIYGQFSFSEVVGYTRYDGSTVFTNEPISMTIRNTMTDLSGRLGYQFFLTSNASIIPYGTLGYHRWLRSIGYPETYHNNWAGLGALLQWAASSKLVLSVDGNVGNTFNAQLHNWNTFYPPYTILMPSELGSRSYVMAGIGADYNFSKKWHALANVNYTRFNYGKSRPTELGVYEPASNTRLLATTVGLGYELD